MSLLFFRSVARWHIILSIIFAHHLVFASCEVNNDGTITASNGTIWQLCALGENYSNGRCEGQATFLGWEKAINAAKNNRFLERGDWYLPSKIQTYQLIEDGTCNHPHISRIGVKGYLPNYFNNQRFVSKIKERIWLSDTNLYNNIYWIHYINSDWQDMKTSHKYYVRDSTVINSASDNDIYTLLVRGGDGAGVFAEALTVPSKVQSEIAAAASREIVKRDLETAEQNRLLAEKNAIEKQFQAILKNNNPQTMYLAAGAYSRNGDNTKANSVYDAIISRFSNTQWAVKANDQLNDSKRANDVERAANQRQINEQRAAQDADSRSKGQCGIRISRCEDSCSPLSGSSKTSCWNSCKSLCNQF